MFTYQTVILVRDKKFTSDLKENNERYSPETQIKKNIDKAIISYIIR